MNTQRHPMSTRSGPWLRVGGKALGVAGIAWGLYLRWRLSRIAQGEPGATWNWDIWISGGGRFLWAHVGVVVLLMLAAGMWQAGETAESRSDDKT